MSSARGPSGVGWSRLLVDQQLWQECARLGVSGFGHSLPTSRHTRRPLRTRPSTLACGRMTTRARKVVGDHPSCAVYRTHARLFCHTPQSDTPPCRFGGSGRGACVCRSACAYARRCAPARCSGVSRRGALCACWWRLGRRACRRLAGVLRERRLSSSASTGARAWCATRWRQPARGAPRPASRPPVRGRGLSVGPMPPRLVATERRRAGRP